MKGFRFGWAIFLVVYSASTEARPQGDGLKKKCLVDEIQLQQDFDLHKFSGRWYDIAHVGSIHGGHNLASAVHMFNVTESGSLQSQLGGERDGRCIHPIVAQGWQQAGPKLNISYHGTNGLQTAPVWVVSSDYTDYAVVYSCTKIRGDQQCHKHHKIVTLMSRTPRLSHHIRNHIDAVIQDQLCVDPAELDDVKQSRTCPPDPDYRRQDFGMQSDDPQVCTFAGVQEYTHLDIDKFMGDWYIRGTYNTNQRVIHCGHVYMNKDQDGMIRTYFTGVRPTGMCFPTLQGSLRLYADRSATFYADYGSIKERVRIYKNNIFETIFEEIQLVDHHI